MLCSLLHSAVASSLLGPNHYHNTTRNGPYCPLRFVFRLDPYNLAVRLTQIDTDSGSLECSTVALLGHDFTISTHPHFICNPSSVASHKDLLFKWVTPTRVPCRYSILHASTFLLFKYFKMHVLDTVSIKVILKWTTSIGDIITV